MKSVDRKLRVFLCHSSQDKPIVRELYQRLNAEGWIDPWLDEEKLLPGQDWDMQIEKAVETSDAVVICLSKDSVSKEGYIQKELRIVLDVALHIPEETIFLLPLRLEDCKVPKKLLKYQYIDYYPNERKEWAFSRLLESLKTRADDKRLVIPRKESFTPSGHRVYAFGGIEFLLIPKGEFLMGSNSTFASIGEKPQHLVSLSSEYWMARYPITNTQFSQFIRSSGTSFQIPYGDPDHPVIRINWREAQAFVKWLNVSVTGGLPNGYNFCLPSEAEWEKAARGEDGREWPWGNKFDQYFCNSNEGGRNTTTPVGFYMKYGDSPYGVSDMAGNVWEWTQSLYKPYPYDSHDGREGKKDFGSYTLRGGSYLDNRIDVRCSSRKPGVASGIEVAAGFRIAIAPR